MSNYWPYRLVLISLIGLLLLAFQAQTLLFYGCEEASIVSSTEPDSSNETYSLQDSFTSNPQNHEAELITPDEADNSVVTEDKEVISNDYPSIGLQFTEGFAQNYGAVFSHSMKVNENLSYHASINCNLSFQIEDTKEKDTVLMKWNFWEMQGLFSQSMDKETKQYKLQTQSDFEIHVTVNTRRKSIEITHLGNELNNHQPFIHCLLTVFKQWLNCFSPDISSSNTNWIRREEYPLFIPGLLQSKMERILRYTYQKSFNEKKEAMADIRFSGYFQPLDAITPNEDNMVLEVKGVTSGNFQYNLMHFWPDKTVIHNQSKSAIRYFTETILFEEISEIKLETLENPIQPETP